MVTVVEVTFGGGGTHADGILWEAATDNDHVSADELQRGLCLEKDHSLGSGSLHMAGSTVDATRYREVTFDSAVGRYSPIDDSGAGLTTTGVTAIRFDEGFERVIGLHLEATTLATTTALIRDPGSTSRIDGCTVRNLGTTGYNSRHATDGMHYWNTVFICGGTGGFRCDTSVNMDMLNCVVYAASGATAAEGIEFKADDAASTVIRNTICMGFSNDWEFDVGSSNGTYSDNISSDATAPGGASSFQNETDTDIFTDPGSDDFTLKSGGNAIDTGVDLSGTFTTDLAGTTRSGDWDIGAYNFAAVGGGLSIPVAMASYRRRHEMKV